MRLQNCKRNFEHHFGTVVEQTVEDSHGDWKRQDADEQTKKPRQRDEACLSAPVDLKVAINLRQISLHQHSDDCLVDACIQHRRSVVVHEHLNASAQRSRASELQSSQIEAITQKLDSSFIKSSNKLATMFYEASAHAHLVLTLPSIDSSRLFGFATSRQ